MKIWSELRSDTQQPKGGIDLANQSEQLDFNTLRVVPNRFQNQKTALVLDMDYWAVATLRPFQTKPIARTGDSEARQILVEYTLEACNEAASGAVYDLTTS